MTISFYKSGGLNGSSYGKIPLRSSALVNINNNDKYCIIWSMLASLHPCNINPNRVSNCKHYYNELNTQSFDFTNGIKCSDMHKFEKLNKLSINIYELTFYIEQKKKKHKLIPIEFSKNESDRVIDLAINKNHYALIKKVNVFSGKEDNKYICRRCLNSCTSEKMIIKHKQHCIQKNN